MRMRHHIKLIVLICAMLLFSYPALAEFSQQGPKLVGTGSVTAAQGNSVSVSADGNTAIVGGGSDNLGGGMWVWTRSGGVWTQQGSNLVGSGAAGNAAYQGWSVSLSGDGNTAIVGGENDNPNRGAAWVWTRSAGVWNQQGPKLVGSDAVGPYTQQGYSVALSGDGNTAIVGGYADNSQPSGLGVGAAWVWTRSGGVWSQMGPKLVGSGTVGNISSQGSSVSLSADGNTAIVGGPGDNSSPAGNVGAAWVFAAHSSPPTCDPPDPDFVYPDDRAAFGLFAGSQQAALDGGTTNVSYRIDPTDVISGIFHKRAIGLWFSITAIEYDSTIIQLEPDNTDTIGGDSAAAGIISPDGHANYIIRFCKPGEVTFKLEFDKPAIALTLLEQFVPFTSDVRELSQGLLEIPLYDSAVTHYVQAWQSTGYTDLLRGLFRTVKDLSALARNRQQKAMIVAVFKRFGINITLNALADTLVKVVRDLPKLIIDVWTYDALLAGGKPLELKLVAPATHTH